MAGVCHVADWHAPDFADDPHASNFNFGAPKRNAVAQGVSVKSEQLIAHLL